MPPSHNGIALDCYIRRALLINLHTWSKIPTLGVYKNPDPSGCPGSTPGGGVF
tara:strand:+ start:832 stop:990 length:159 start_codon:yes stop_codon:yes gene_type:complete